jgi:hypothetical protein
MPGQLGKFEIKLAIFKYSTIRAADQCKTSWTSKIFDEYTCKCVCV